MDLLKITVVESGRCGIKCRINDMHLSMHPSIRNYKDSRKIQREKGKINGRGILSFEAQKERGNCKAGTV
jgi:hypothetical protein